jgi:hypothetical protein
MPHTYIFQKPHRRSRYTAYRRRLMLLVALLLFVGGIGVFIYVNLRVSAKGKSIITPVQYSTFTSPLQTFTSPYFKFQDTGKWVLDQKDSTAKEYLYTDYLGQIQEAQLTVYINQEPVRAYTTRVLPVRIVNSNSFEITGVSDPCANQYSPGELHRVKQVSIKDAKMLCDPDDPQYSVVLSEIGGDYHLHLRRADGSPVQVVMIYRNQDINPRPNNLLTIARNFQTL